MKTLSIIFLIIYSFQLMTGQTCDDPYVPLTDASGFDRSPYQEDLEAAACELIQALPFEYQNQFKVFDFGFYSLTEFMEGGYQEVWNQAIQDAQSQSPYYLLFGKQSDSKGIYTKFWIDINLPNEWLNQCFDDAYIQVLKTSFINKFEQLHVQYDIPFQYADVESEGMDFMSQKLLEIKECCQPGFSSNSTCTSCITATDVYNELISLNFQAFSFCQVLNPDIEVDQSCLCLPDIATFAPNVSSNANSISEITDLANYTISLQGQVIDLEQQLDALSNQTTGVNFSGFITKNKSFCDPQKFVDFNANFEASTMAAWIHIWESENENEPSILFFKSKLNDGISLAPVNITTDESSADPPPPYQFKITQRCFAPWDRFGHFPIFPNIHIGKNSFHGDNRGFSLDKSVSRTSELGVTSRVNQFTNVILGDGVQPSNVPTRFTSETEGFRDCIREIPIYSGNPAIPTSIENAVEQKAFGQVSGFENSKIKNNITYVAMNIKGSNPLATISPNIKWYLELKMAYINSSASLSVIGSIKGKEFPAYEAIIEDNCGQKTFLHKMTSPSEDKLGAELMWPLFDYNQPINITIFLNSAGCFLNNTVVIEQEYTLDQWNDQNLTKAPALDCPESPCEGIYPNEE